MVAQFVFSPNTHKLLSLCLFLFATASSLFAQTAKKTYTTKRIDTAAPIIDGLPDDAAWKTVEWGTDFTQRQPADGEKPTFQTAFKILYDDRNFYMLIRAFDAEPKKIVQRMSRRDGFEGDWVEVNIDSYFDQRSAFSFTTSASGVKGDEAISNNGDNWDPNWDPIWYVKTSVDEQGWLSEFRIPLTQLRFGNKENHVWGLQVTRRNFRKEEISNWQYIPQNAPGWVHLFGELHGITGIKSQQQLEVQPYVVGKVERSPKEEGNPFASGHAEKLTAGVDGKIGLTSDVTLDFTINPDFGQVEADPSQVNLTAFEVFFNEQRPFFVESKNITDYPITTSIAEGPYTTDNLFYSRRIGRPPQYDPDTGEHEFIRKPQNTSILGAFKLTGKTRKGFSFGILESVTSRGQATIDSLGFRRKVAVEPMTNYVVARAQQDFNKGKTIVGAMLTATNRQIKDAHLNFLHKAAYTGGVDLVHNWQDRNYYYAGNFIFSTVQGSEEAMLATQQAQQRYFQRPNARHLSVDSTRTSLSGTGGTFKLGKSGGKLRFESGATWRSPGLSLNDVGFLRSADQINQWLWVGYQVTKPFKIYRNFFVNFNQYRNWDFGGVNTYNGLNVNFRTQFKNYWWIGSGISPDFTSISNADLRGGPSLQYPGGWGHWYAIESDNRKKLQISFEHSNFWGNHQFSREQNISVGVSYRPAKALQISLTPAYGNNHKLMQYVATAEQEGQNHYIMGELDQKTVSMAIRLNYIIKPNLSIQYYGQPFASTGKYHHLKRVTNSKASQLEDRFHVFADNEIGFDELNNQYQIRANGPDAPAYAVDNPNFDFVQFRSNLVGRWEYIPGSTLFLVWSQGRTSEETIANFAVNSLSRSLFEMQAHNVFLVKYTYRFVR